MMNGAEAKAPVKKAAGNLSTKKKVVTKTQQKVGSTKKSEVEKPHIQRMGKKERKKKELPSKSTRKVREENALMDKYQKQTNAKEGIWLDLLSNDIYKMLIDMNYSDAVIEKWQKSRVLKSVMLGVIGLAAGIVMGQPMIMGGGPALAFALYFMEGSKIKTSYRNYKFYRALQFAKFTRLVVPYLRSDSAGGTESRVHSTLAAVMERLDSDEDKQLLATLLNEIAQMPDDKQPYINYAQKVANNDFALTFMETLFDIRQGSASLAIIERMSRESNEQIQNLTEDIIQLKSKKFLMFPTKVAMTSIIIIIGCTVAILMQNIQGFSF